MRFYYRLAAVLALLLLCLSNPIPATLADSPSPTPKPRTVSAPGNGVHKVFLPLILGNGPIPTLTSKKGVPLTYDHCEDVTAMNAAWEYDWTTTPPNCPGVEYVPMIWGKDNVAWPLGGNSNWIMGFNEPDSIYQANISPPAAAELWRQIELNHSQQKLLSPAPTGSLDGLSWLVSFRNEYFSRYRTAPRLDGLAVHCYKWYASQCVDLVQSFINQANAWEVPEVWVTEFSFSTIDPSSPPGALQEQQTFINWMANQSKITRYAWFASRIEGHEWWSMSCHITPLVDYITGQPTSLGNAYRQFP